MNWIGETLRRLATAFRRGRLHRELDEEIRHHLEMKAQSGVEQGLLPDEARFAAEREFGNSLLLREQGREAWGWLWLDRLGQDLRYSWRQLRRSPGFAVIAILTMALGIGANAVIFSAVNAVILHPLPFRDADGILTLWVSTGQGVVYSGPAAVCGPDYAEWSRQTRLFASVSGFAPLPANFTGRGTPERLIGAEITSGLFPLLGVGPAFGRNFSASDQQSANARVILLSDRLWRSRFAADRGVVGQSVKLDGQFFTVAGVMPPGFGFPNESDFWTPLVLGSDCHNEGMRVLVRLQAGVPLEQARSEVGVLSAALDRKDGRPKQPVVTLMPLSYEIAGDFRTPLLVLLGAVGLVLLIACVNVANLLVARSATRQREIAIRSALGAGRARVVRQMITESTLLGVLGGALGLLLAYGGYPLIASAASHLPHGLGSPTGAARIAAAGIDGWVIGFTLGLSLLTGLLFGLAPALRASRPDVAGGMKQRASDSGTQRGRFQDLLVAGEVALALVILVGAGLLIRSFLALVNVDPGFAPANVLTMNLQLPESRYQTPAEMIAFERQALDRLSALPGSRATGAILGLPLGSIYIRGDITVEGAPPTAPGAPPIEPGKHVVGGDYFRAAGIALRSGRYFTDQDNRSSRHVMIVSESLARRLWPRGQAVGKRVDAGFSNAGWCTVVGVVGDVKQRGLDKSASLAIYLPYEQLPVPYLTLILRTSSDPLSAVPAARHAIESVDPELPLYDVASMEQLIYNSVSEPRFNTTLLAIFAGLALVLATVGIYGVMSYTVTQRTHEIGIRMALGARSGDVLRSVIAQGALRAGAGIVLGLTGALFLTRFLRTLLFGVHPMDPMTFAAVAALLAGVALLASYIPARRAMRIDPLAALRCE
ncbi:MAG TPA: ABC transporter permease [Terriglobia bacterium]|nr:ABC transporter permease [Terriglobia bacterium]